MLSNSTATLSLNNGKQPMISAGALTPELLHHFEHHTHGYLNNKDGLNKEGYVNHIIYSFKDPLVELAPKVCSGRQCGHLTYTATVFGQPTFFRSHCDL